MSFILRVVRSVLPEVMLSEGWRSRCCLDKLERPSGTRFRKQVGRSTDLSILEGNLDLMRALLLAATMQCDGED